MIWMHRSLPVWALAAMSLGSAAWGQGYVEVTPGASGTSASTHDGNVPGNAVDGSLDTRWSADGDGAWLQLDLGTTRTVGYVRVAVYRGDTRQGRFDVQVAATSGAWTTVWSGLSTGATTALVTYDFADVDARWVRYVGHGNTASTWNSVTEMEVFAVGPTPTAPPASTPTPTATPASGVVEITPSAGGVTASTHDGNLPANTVDSNLSTRWSANGDGQWIRYDLGTVRTVAFLRIAVHNGNTRQNRFDLQTSSDGAVWTPLVTGVLTGGTTTLEETYDFTDVNTRFIRYVGHGSTTSTFNSLTEVSIYGPGGATVTPTPTPTPRSTPGTFRHPGVLVNRAQLDFVKSKIQAGAEPWTSALAKARNDSHASLNYTPHPFAVVECGPYSTPNNGCTEEIDDGVAAWTHALLWYYTGNSAHARKSIEILNAWSSTITAHTEHNAPLQAGWTGATFAAASEIIKHTGAGWSSTDASRMANKLRTVWLPMVLKTSCANGNWESIMTNASVNIAVFLDDRTSFNQALTLWRNRVRAYSYQTTDGALPRQTVPNCGRDTAAEIISFWHGQSTFRDGVGQESCRDFGHMEWGLIAQTHAAETAYQQGVDLYAEESERLRDALELHALYDLGTPVPSWLCGGTIKTSTSQSWEVFYNHYATRKGYPLPNARRMILERVRPSGFNRFYGWDTLTHAGVGSVGIP